MPDMNDKTEKERVNEKAFRDEGFIVEKHGSVTIYRRPVSDDVIEASMSFAKRTIGYTSRDIPGRKHQNQD
jgi:hypothetical protein